MGIYRTLLEEEVPHLDDNNNPDSQIKELQDVVEDHDANEAEQQAAQDAAFGPDGGVDDIMDESAIAIYEFELGHNQILQAIGMRELQEASMGRDFIMEAADIKAFFEKIKDKIKEFFKKVWSVIQRWTGNFMALIRTNKGLWEKYSSQIKEGEKLYADSSKKMSGYPFTGIKGKEYSEKEANDAMNDIVSKSKEFSAEDAENIVNSVRGYFCSANGKEVSAGDYSAELKKYLYGEKEENFKMTSDQIKVALTEDLRKPVKEMAKKAKEQFNKAMESVKKMENEAKSDKNAESSNVTISLCTRKSTAIRGCLTATQQFRNAYCIATRMYALQARKFAMAYIAASNKNKHKGFRKESAEYGFLGNLI